MAVTTHPVRPIPHRTMGRGKFQISVSLLVYKVFYFMFWGSLGCFLPFLALYFKQFGFTASKIGFVNSLRPFFGFVFVPVISAVADKFHCRKLVLMVGSAAGSLVVIIIAVIPRAPQVSCGVMEEQIREFLHLNISLPFRGIQDNSSDYFITTNGPEISERWKRSIGSKTSANTPFVHHYLPISSPAIVHKTRNDTIDKLNQFPRRVQEILFANQSWLYDKDALFRLSVILIVLTSFVDIFLFASSCQADTATLDALIYEDGNVDQYGWQRGFGSLGWGICSFFAAQVLNSSRTLEISCGIEHITSSYWILFVCSIGVNCITFLSILYFRFPHKDIGNISSTGSSSWVDVKNVVFRWHYGSIIILICFIGVCHGCIWGFLFWHLENLGATQGLLGMLTVLFSVSEFLFTYLSGWGIAKFGHVNLMCVGLLLYLLRFIYYGLVTVPWMMIFIDVFHGMSFVVVWTTVVSYLSESIPPQCEGTMQGIIVSMHQGLGAGLGFLISGLLIERYGAQWTFLLFAASCGVLLIGFIIIQVICPAPPLPWKEEVTKTRLLQKTKDLEETNKQLLENPGNSSIMMAGQLCIKLPTIKMETKTVKQQS